MQRLVLGQGLQLLDLLVFFKNNFIRTSRLEVGWLVEYEEIKHGKYLYKMKVLGWMILENMWIRITNIQQSVKPSLVLIKNESNY